MHLHDLSPSRASDPARSCGHLLGEGNVVAAAGTGWVAAGTGWVAAGTGAVRSAAAIGKMAACRIAGSAAADHHPVRVDPAALALQHNHWPVRHSKLFNESGSKPGSL